MRTETRDVDVYVLLLCFAAIGMSRRRVERVGECGELRFACSQLIASVT